MPIIKSPVDASASAPEFGADVRDGLIGLWIPSTSVERTAVNLAPGKPILDMTIVGSPTMVEAGSAIQFKGLQDYMESLIYELPTYTVYMLGRSLEANSSSATRSQYFGTRSAPPADTETLTFGTAIYTSASGAIRMSAGFGNSTADDEAVTNSVSKVDSAWDLIVGKVAATGGDKGIYVKNLSTDGTPATDTSALPRLVSRMPFRWGSGYTTEEGTNQQAWLQVHNKYMSDEQDQQVLAQVRAFQMAKWGRTT